MVTTGQSGGVGGNPWAWLGLLKWSLAYSDGTKPSSEDMLPMSEEDRAFLESVMKEGIIDENERMKTILKEVTAAMSKWKTEQFSLEEAENVEDLLQELRDIVEQIDYARAFAAMKGLHFLLGCVQEREFIPKSSRTMCLGITATMCQHNPPVQQELLELGSLKILSDLFFEIDLASAEEDSDGQFRARIIQAISANVRSHELAENVFSNLEQARSLIERGLGVGDANTSTTPKILRQRTLFFLRAIVTSDSTSRQRMDKFAACIAWVIDNLLDKIDGNDCDYDLIEMSLAMVEQILEQKKSVNTVLSRKDAIAALAVQRISAIRAMEGDDREYADNELRLWENVLQLLARTSQDGPEPPLQPMPGDILEERNKLLPQ